MDESIFSYKFKYENKQKITQDFKTLEKTNDKYNLGILQIEDKLNERHNNYMLRRLRFTEDNFICLFYSQNYRKPSFDEVDLTVKYRFDKKDNLFTKTKRNSLDQIKDYYGDIVGLNSLFLYKKFIPYLIKDIPTYFGIGISLENLINPIITIAIGNKDVNTQEEVKDDLMLLELAKSFIKSNDLQIIDYIQDKDYKIGKLF